MTTNKGVIVEAAPAKINLALHVTGQRADGYHLLDSLVIFADVGDVIAVAPAPDLTLTIDGPFAAGLKADNNNLVLQAARLFGVSKGAAITLTKNLPVASGIGGGSADAAATLRALSQLWDTHLPNLGAQLSLGADVPVCMANDLTRMQGIGESITRIGLAPKLPMLLVNPNVAVSTPVVFSGLATKSNPAMMDPMPDPRNLTDWLWWLTAQRNDLEGPAQKQSKKITMALAALAHFDGCALSRMSGSGATCFAIFKDEASREAAYEKLRFVLPSWWVVKTETAT